MREVRKQATASTEVQFTRDESAGHESANQRGDCILDAPWCGEFDLVAFDAATSVFCPEPESTPVLIAGKASSPDEDALWLAERVLSSPYASLSPLLQLDPPIGFSPDQWMLSGIWFPYQKYRACWYVTFTTEYSGGLELGVRAQTEGAACDSVEVVNSFMNADNAAGYCQDSFTSVAHVVAWIVRQLRREKVSSKKFSEILDRIDKERLFGTEIVDPLISVVEESKDRVPEWLYAHWKTRLQRCAAALAASDTRL
jgi:hypothetical protein